ncbi:hypothetical protein VP01_337g8 [Puccinia sorghi]|uniref:Integrase catalytic domain-containing protein n=1 Tax=Puccinia sorghi TaxID=27349 RepID=A0A0L6UWR0_9BASI|nr:hypothetical protein VP01_337g8 [Puccinia sorghi]
MSPPHTSQKPKSSSTTTQPHSSYEIKTASSMCCVFDLFIILRRSDRIKSSWYLPPQLSLLTETSPPFYQHLTLPFLFSQWTTKPCGRIESKIFSTFKSCPSLSLAKPTLSLIKTMKKALKKSGNPSWTTLPCHKPPIEFITNIKTAISRLHEVGIVLPEDIVAYLILHKLPSSMSSISQKITHSEKEICPELVLDHLHLYLNDQQLLSNHAAPRGAPTALVADESTKCRKGWHNPASTTHVLSRCFSLYPHLRPNQGKNEATVSSFHSSVSPSSTMFVLDSGASSHMVSDMNLFVSLELADQGVVRTSSGKDSLVIKGIGTIKLSNQHGTLLLNNVFFIPDLFVNLLSVHCLVLNNYHIEFLKYTFNVSIYNKLVMSGHYEGNLPSLHFSNTSQTALLNSAELLHKSLGHSCEACAVSKITRASFKSSHARASRPFEELHLDLIGPITPESREGDKYILTVVDSNTRFCSATPIRLKSEVPETLSSLIDFEAKRFGYYPSVLHSDRGREFINSTMENFCKKHLIRCRTSDPYTPQQNGLAERHNRTIIESLRTILEDSGLSKKFWSDVIKASTLTLNQIPSHRSKKSPFELFKLRTLPLDYFRPIGNRVSYLIQPSASGSKIFPKGGLGQLLGYNDEIQSYKILSDDGRIVDTKSVTFLDFVSQKSTNSDEEDFEVMIEDLWNQPSPMDKVISETDPVTPLEEPLAENPMSYDIVQVKTEDSEESNIPDDATDTSDESDGMVAESLIPSSTRVLRERTSKVRPVKLLPPNDMGLQNQACHPVLC